MEPATMTALGTLASGAGSLLSGFGFGGGGNKVDEGAIRGLNDINGRHQKDMEFILRQQEFNQKMDLAKQHGLHPLSVLGVPMGGGSVVTHTVPEDNRFPDFAQIGYGASQIAGSFVKPPPEDPMVGEMRELELRRLRAETSRAEWEALGTEFRVADMAAPKLLMGQPGNPPGARTSNDATILRDLAAAQSGISPSLIAGSGAPISMKQEILPPHPRNLGYAAGTDQALVSTMDPTGKPGTVLNQNAFQAEFNDGATMTLLVKHFGVDRAVEIMSALEQSGVVGGMALGAVGAAKLWYDRMAKQRADALSRRRYTPQWRGRGGRAGSRNE